MTIKWSVNKAIESLRTLNNPFEMAGIQNPAQKPKLSDILNTIDNVEDNVTGEAEISNGIS